MLNTAIIVAPDGKGLTPVFRVPAARRLATIVSQLGLKSIHLIGQVDPLRSVLSDLLDPSSFHSAEDALKLRQVVKALNLPPEEPVLALKANHVIDRPSLSRLLEAGREPGIYYMGQNGASVPDGIYTAHPEALASILGSLWSGERPDPAVWALAEQVESFGGLPHTLDGDDSQARVTEAKLFSALSSQSQAGDGFMARHFDRKISLFISKRLARTDVSPNQITLAGIATGALAAFFFSRPGYWPNLLGAFLFLLCVVIDGVDGEVARLKVKESVFGHYLDVITDNVVHIAIFAGMSYGFYLESGNGMYLRLFWVLMGGFGLCAVVVYYCVLRRPQNELKDSAKSVRILTLLTNRDFAYLIAAVAAVDLLNWFFIATSVGAYLFAFALWGFSLFDKRRAAAARTDGGLAP